ncbi:MAG: zf-HC2 domain-containing protein [Gaiellales bacterium]
MKLRHLLGPRCSRARMLGSAELDGSLSELEQAEMDRHLRECPICQQVVADMAELTIQVRSAPLRRPPSPVPVAPPSRRRRFGALAGVATAAAAAAALGAVVATPWHRGQPTAPQTTSLVVAQRYDVHHPWPTFDSRRSAPVHGGRP